MSEWGRKVTPENAWRSYPRPQMERDTWMNLNGHWDYAIRPANAPQPAAMDGKILVPFAVESRSEEHTSELQSLMRISSAVFCLKKKTRKQRNTYDMQH